MVGIYGKGAFLESFSEKLIWLCSVWEGLFNGENRKSGKSLVKFYGKTGKDFVRKLNWKNGKMVFLCPIWQVSVVKGIFLLLQSYELWYSWNLTFFCTRFEAEWKLRKMYRSDGKTDFKNPNWDRKVNFSSFWFFGVFEKNGWKTATEKFQDAVNLDTVWYCRGGSLAEMLHSLQAGFGHSKSVRKITE